MDEDEILQEETYTENENTEPVIYTGPNIITFGLMQYLVMTGGLPPYVRRAIEKIPEIESLIVPVSELESMKQKVRKAGTNEARLFYTVQEEAAKINTEYRKKSRRRVK